MKVIEALNILGITKVKNLSEKEAKTAYRKSCLAYHPDRNPAGNEMIKIVIDAWETLKKNGFPLNAEIEESELYDYGAEINEALNKIINLEGVIVEVCGSWVWVSGSKYEQRKIFCPPRQYDENKKAIADDEIRFKWSRDKRRWYYRPQTKKCFKFSGNLLSMEEIQKRYGSSRIKSKTTYRLSA